VFFDFGVIAVSRAVFKLCRCVVTVLIVVVVTVRCDRNSEGATTREKGSLSNESEDH